MENNTDPSTQRALTPLVERFRARRAVVAGFLVWLIATVVTGVMASERALDAISRYWLLHFMAGGLVMVMILAIFALFGKVRAPRFISSLTIYFLPTSFLVIGWEAICSIYTNQANSDALRVYAPILMLPASAVGLIVGEWLTRRHRRDFLSGTLVPPAIMACIALGYFGIRTFTSDAFRYRDAFTFAVQDSHNEGGVLSVNCLLTLKKDGDYTYSASPLPDELSSESNSAGELAWIGSKEPPSAAGSYQVKVTWHNARQQLAGLPGSEASFSVGKKSGGEQREVMSFPIPLDSSRVTSGGH